MLSIKSWNQFAASILVASSLVQAANFDVQVAQSGLSFTPDHVDNVAAMDTVTFHWTVGPHSATQGSLASPCSPLSGGFDSGLLSTGTYQITVNDTNPVWVYCQVTGHCQQGMVFAVNANATALAQFQGTATGHPPSSASSAPSGSSSASSGASSPTSSNCVNNGYGSSCSPAPSGSGGNGFATKSLIGGVGLSAIAGLLGAMML